MLKYINNFFLNIFVTLFVLALSPQILVGVGCWAGGWEGAVLSVPLFGEFAYIRPYRPEPNYDTLGGQPGWAGHPGAKSARSDQISRCEFSVLRR